MDTFISSHGLISVSQFIQHIEISKPKHRLKWQKH